MAPLVSVKMITYNHVRFIARAIEGIIAQRTTFKIEFVIGDDCSTDGTTEIIESYARRYPSIIKHVRREKNLGAIANAKDLNNYLNGKYVALCEGDDFWTDPLKLEKQVTFMEKNPDYSMCFHPARVIREDGVETKLFKNLEEREYATQEILKNWVVPTGSVLFIHEYYKSFYYHPDYLYTDIALFLTLANYGRIWCLGESMSVYQRHMEGITQMRHPLNKRVAHFRAINIQFGHKYNVEISGIITSIYWSSTKERLQTGSIKAIWDGLFTIYYLTRHAIILLGRGINKAS